MAMASLAIPPGTRPSAAAFGSSRQVVVRSSPACFHCSSGALQGWRRGKHGGGGALNAVATVNPPSTLEPQKTQKTQYHFLVANAKFMLDEEEHLQELLRERLRHYSERSVEQDFWLVIEPRFLEKFPSMTKRLGRPAVALVSTNPVWITYMKLRIDRVLKGVYESDSFADATASGVTDLRLDAASGQWTAPYPKYETGWWTPFLPPAAAPATPAAS